MDVGDSKDGAISSASVSSGSHGRMGSRELACRLHASLEVVSMKEKAGTTEHACSASPWKAEAGEFLRI